MAEGQLGAGSLHVPSLHIGASWAPVGAAKEIDINYGWIEDHWPTTRGDVDKQAVIEDVAAFGGSTLGLLKCVNLLACGGSFALEVIALHQLAKDINPQVPNTAPAPCETYATCKFDWNIR